MGGGQGQQSGSGRAAISELGFSLLLAGDAIIIRPWSQEKEPSFLRLIDQIQSADVAIANLETVIHDFNGHAQADSHGTYMHSSPLIAAELKWAGFDMVAHANNHTFDYGSTAVLETLKHAEDAGLVIAGSGSDLQEARRPRYFDCPGGRVALVAMASTFVPYGRASRSRPDLDGRPGLNPLTLLDWRWTLVLPRPFVAALKRMGRWFRKGFKDLDGESFELGKAFLSIRFREGRFGVYHDRWPHQADRMGNLEAVSEAARNADIVVVSIHAHNQGRWLRAFAKEVIDQGASVVFVHGPHQVRAVEVYKGRPILYSLGDFVYESSYVAKHPSDAYARAGLGDEAGVTELLDAPGAVKSLAENPETFEGVIATLWCRGADILRVELHPVSLQFEVDDEQCGRPRLADESLGRQIIQAMAEKSKRFGVKIQYNASENRGEIETLN